MSRRLTPDEQALWERVAATVLPLRHQPVRPVRACDAAPVGASTSPPPDVKTRRLAGPVKSPATKTGAPKPSDPPPGRETLDASWDRKLHSGSITPDYVIDLHGLSVEGARSLLYRRVLDAEARGARVILVITGKGKMPGPAPADLMPGLGGDRSGRRGAIRMELPRWVGEAQLSGRIAAVRRAHPRHGGAGAAYLILKRQRNKV